MIILNEKCYGEIALLLKDRIEGLGFFNGSVGYDTEEFYSELTCTLIIYRDGNGRLSNVAPVWWEYHLFMSDGEQLTDFDWNEFNYFLK